MSAAIASLPPVESRDWLSQLFGAHYRRVLMAAYRITGNMADAEDVAQALFLRLGRGEAPAMANAGSYLYRAAINGALDLLRQKRNTEPLEAAAGVASDDADGAPEERVRSEELQRQLRHSIAELPPRAAEMFALRYLEEMSNGEIAGLMGTSQAVVAVTLYQSRAKLKRRLTEMQRGMR
ncbi:MAG TPA: sigma-70 family RNA polymerase sigma factor [Terracidiphilus sp.]